MVRQEDLTFLSYIWLAYSSAVASGNRDPAPSCSIGSTQTAFGLEGMVGRLV